MPHFFVEFRFHDYPKRYLKELMHEVARKFRVRGAIRHRPVPHMALFYGSRGRTDIRKVFAAVERVWGKYTLVPFKIDKFETRDGEEGKVIAAGITASPELKKLRVELRKELGKIWTPHRFDTQPNFWFHTVISFKDIDRKFGNIWRYINSKKKPSIDQHLVRITILNQKRRIEREYDLIFKKWLSRREALSKRLYQKTVNRLRELLGQPPEQRLSSWQRFINWIQGLSGKKRIYLIGDTHFDHANIIKHVKRPFANVRLMNRALVRNWNNTVKPRDTVYFLGDWAFRRRGARAAKYWRRKLKGHVISIRGNHDRGQKGIRFKDFKVIRYQGYSFLLIHRPGLNDPGQNRKQKQKLEEWHGWVIHGHKHNNNMRRYPFINGRLKTINVGVELTNYKPVSLDYLLSLDINSIKRMETISSKPERW